MTKDEWRKLDKTTGMPFRRIADGLIGEAEYFFKDTVMMQFHGKREERTLCPCEMLALPDAPWPEGEVNVRR